jgi:hypothetical protein
MCSGHRPCSLIAPSHFMPGCGTMIPSLGSPRSPIVGPPPFGDSSPQTALADGDWIPDVLHRCCKSLLSSVFSTQSFTVACGMEVVGVPTPGGGFVQQMSTCTRCGGLTFSLAILSMLECIVLMLFGDSSLLPFCTLWTCEGQSCNWCPLPACRHLWINISPPPRVISLKKLPPTDGRLHVRWRRRGGWRSGNGGVVWLWDGVAYMGAGTCQIVRHGM